MKINNADNFTHIIVKFLKALGFENVKETDSSEEGIDITAQKDKESYCFKCQYDMDAISEKKMDALCKVYETGKYDKAVFVTNSSFISGAKKRGESAGVLLWDRNTVDRMAIGIAESLEDKVVETKKNPGIFIGAIAVAAVIIIALAVYFLIIR